MKHIKNTSKNPNSNSSSPHSRSRSRSQEKELHQEKEKQKQRENKFRNSRHSVTSKSDEGKLYLANIPLSIPQQKIKQEFEKYGKILDYNFRRKTDVPHPYYYGYITLTKKNEAEEAMKNIVNEFNWTVEPFDKETKDKNSNREKNLNNLNNLNYNLNNNVNIIKSPNEDLSQNDENNNINSSNIKVREILVSNLPLSINENNLYKEFFIFGEISKIELKTIDNKKIAFIKYRLINSAMKAIEKEKNINFFGNIIDVNYSNVNQRKDIKGNELNYELNDNNCKLVVLCLNKNIDTIDEDNALKIFENFGSIKNIIIKNINSRNHIFVEYYKPEDAKRCIENISINTETKKFFGDENCEINFYFKNKFNEINPCLNLNESNNSNNITNNINNLLPINNTIRNTNLPNIPNMNNIPNIPNLMMPNAGINNMANPALFFQLMQQKNLLNKQINFNNKPNNNQINDINQLNQINQLNNINLTNNLINNINNNNPINPLSKISFPYNRLLYPNQNNFPFPTNPQFLNPNNAINNLNNLQILQNLLNNPNFKNNMINNNNMNNINASHNMIPNYMNVNNKLNLNNFNNIINNNQLNLNNNMSMNNNLNTNNNNKTNEVKDILNQIMSDKNNQKNNNSNSDSDISSVNGSHQSAEEMEFEKEYSLESENLPEIWTGFLTKNGKDRTSVDMYKIRGNIDDSYFKEYNINVCNRIQYEEVLKKRELGLVAISPQSITQKENFDLFLNYLYDKQRCGVVILSDNKYTLFLVSPCEFSKKFYVNPKKHLLGIIVDNSDQGGAPINLPPPVISLAEKRKLKAKKNKNENKKETKETEQDMIMKLKEQLKNMENNEDDEEKKNLEEIIRQNPNIKDIFDKL